MASRATHSLNANGVPSSSPGLFRPNETTLGSSHPTKPPTLKGLNRCLPHQSGAKPDHRPKISRIFSNRILARWRTSSNDQKCKEAASNLSFIANTDGSYCRPTT